MPNPDKVGWYVDVPAALKRKFDAIYPQRGAMTDLTVRAIEQAIQEYYIKGMPSLTEEVMHEDR